MRWRLFLKWESHSTAVLCGDCSRGKTAAQFWGAGFSVWRVACGGGWFEEEEGDEEEGAVYLLALSLFNCSPFSICPAAYFLSVKKIGRDHGSFPLYRLNKHTCIQYVSWARSQTTQEGWQTCRAAVRRTKKKSPSLLLLYFSFSLSFNYVILKYFWLMKQLQNAE